MAFERTKHPGRIVQDLLEQLSRHDKPVGFLFGAGTSAAVKGAGAETEDDKEPLIPPLETLTALCRERVAGLGDRFARAWQTIEAEIGDNHDTPNIEDILSQVELKLRAIGTEETLAGLSRSELGTLDQTIRTTIAAAVQPDEECIPDDSPHDRFAEWLVRVDREQPVELFTTNYDLLIERSLERRRVPVFDGFVGSRRPFFSPESISRRRFAPGAGWVRLWKIHGSVNWKLVAEAESEERVVRQLATDTGEMIFPSSQKYDKSRKQPYTAIMDHLQRFLDRNDVLLVSVGYGFGDQHINEVLFDTLQTRPRAHLAALQYASIDEYSELSEWAIRLQNILALGPEGGVVGGQRSAWSMDGSSEPPSSQAEAGVIVEAEDDGSSDCRLLIGDFERFADYLVTGTTGRTRK